MARATIPKLPWGSSSVSGETLGAGDGIKVTFSGTLAQDQVKEGSLTITAGAQSVSDDGAGNLTGDGSGSVNHVTGAYSVTFNAAPANGTSVTAAYSYFPSTLQLGYPLDNATAYPEPREGSEWVQASSGEEDSWLLGDEQLVEGLARWIPSADTADPVATGWDGAAGWAAFLSWARAKNVFRFFPDAAVASYHSCTLVEPLQGPPALEEDGSRQVLLRLRDTGGVAFTGY